MLELRGLTRRDGELVALDDLSFSVAKGQLFGFVGPTGAGKTAAMRIVLGVLKPDAGQVRWCGQRRYDELRHRVGHIARDYGQTFSRQCGRIRGSAAVTLCQLGQQTQPPPTAPPCRCAKAERHARQ
jgi:ABC-type branched-subunit amino acid transport system ATPase component